MLFGWDFCWFLLGFLGDFIRNLQRHLCVVWLDFCWFFWVSIGFVEIFLFFFWVEILILFFMDSKILVLLLC